MNIEEIKDALRPRSNEFLDFINKEDVDSVKVFGDLSVKIEDSNTYRVDELSSQYNTTTETQIIVEINGKLYRFMSQHDSWGGGYGFSINEMVEVVKQERTIIEYVEPDNE